LACHAQEAQWENARQEADGAIGQERPVRSSTAMVEILKKRKPQRADAGPGFRTEPVPVRRGRT